MEMEPIFPILLTFLLFLFMSIKTLKKTKHTTKLPPSPWKIPIIGNLHQLAAGSLPHHTLRDLSNKHGPLMYLQLGEVPTIVVSSPEMAKEVLKTHDINFSDRPYLLASKILSYDSTNIVFSPYGGYWRQLRKICMSELLSPTRVQSFRSIREDEVSNLIKTISSSEGSAINLSKMIFSFTFSITARSAFGDKCEDQERFISIIAEMLELAAGFCVADMFPSVKVLELISGLRPKLEKLRRQSDEILESIINEHRERKGRGEAEHRDLVDVLLEVQEHGDLESPLTDDNIKAVILDIFVAGSETSSTTLEWAISELLRDPGLMKEAQGEVRRFFEEKGNFDETGIKNLKLLASIIKETLRLHPAGPLLLPRQCRENCVISGYEIPAKAKVIVNGWAIGRDSEYWSDAERFYPERFHDSSVDYKGTHFQYIPFGAGRRICPDISYALPNIELPLARLLYHFDWKLANGVRLEDLDMTEAFALTVRRKEDLFLIPIPYHPSSE